MKILFLTSDYPPHLIGGVGTYTYQWARHLVRRGHQAFVITWTEETPCEYIEQGVRVWRVRPHPMRWLEPARELFSESVRRVEYSVAVAKQIRSITRQYDIDAIESCESRAEGFWHYLFHRQPKLFIKLHTPDGIICELNQEPRSIDLRLMLTIEEWWLRRATTLVGLTDAVAQQVGRRYQLNTDKIPRVRVPVETRFFTPRPELRSHEQPRILYVSRLEFRKGLHVLLRALPRILKVVPNAQITVIGQNAGMQTLLEKYLVDSRYGPHLFWETSVSREQLLAAYQRSHVCVVPSLWENHPAVCLEAMSCGCAVVASRVGGMPELVRHEETGCLVPAGSSVALAKTVSELLTNASACDALGMRARAWVEQHYDLEPVFDDTISVYERMLNGHNGDAAPSA